MMQQAQEQVAIDNEFDAAKAIVEILKGLPTERQERAMRFASETLGLDAPADPAGSASLPPTGQGRTPEEKTETSAPGRFVDIKQFAQSKKPRTDQQFAVVVAYYYRFEAPAKERTEVIRAKELTNAVRLVGGRKQPKDPGMTLHNAKNSGYLDAVGGGKFQINSVGENLVTMALPGKEQPATSTRKGPNRAKKTRRAPAKKRAKKR